MKKEILENPTYEPIKESLNKILSNLMRINSKFNISVEEKDMRIPSLFSNPKFHKTPIKFRFIASFAGTCLKGSSLLLNGILDRLCEKIKLKCESCHYYWIINNNSKVLYAIKSLNEARNAASVMSRTFHFLHKDTFRYPTS